MHIEYKWDSEENKVLDIVEIETWNFFKDHYLPMIEIYLYHQPHFVLLEKSTRKGKKDCSQVWRL